MCIIQIGENVERLSDDFKENHSNIPWRSIKDMRNIMTINMNLQSLMSCGMH